MRIFSWDFIESFVLYVSRVIWRGFRDSTRLIFGSGPSILLTILVTLVSWFVLVKIFQWPITKLTDDMIAPAISLVIAFLIAWAVLLMLRVLVAPILIDTEQRTKIDELNETLKPRLEMLFVEGIPPFEITEPVFTPDSTRRIFRIGVVNSSNNRIICMVKLEKLEGTKNVLLPKVLKQWDDNPFPVSSVAHKTECSLNSKEKQYFDVASFDETNPNQQIILNYAQDPLRDRNRPNMIPIADYELSIIAYSDTGNSVQGNFRLWVENGRLRFQEIKSGA